MDVTFDIEESLNGSIVQPFTEADLIEFQALQEKLDKVTVIEDSMKLGVGHDQVVALEAIQPGILLDNMPSGGFTLKASQQNLKVAMEAAEEAKKGIIERMIDFIVKKIKQLIEWVKGLFTKSAKDADANSAKAKATVKRVEEGEKAVEQELKEAKEPPPEKVVEFEEAQQKRVDEVVQRAEQRSPQNGEVLRGLKRRNPKPASGKPTAGQLSLEAARFTYATAAARIYPVSNFAFSFYYPTMRQYRSVLHDVVDGLLKDMAKDSALVRNLTAAAKNAARGDTNIPKLTGQIDMDFASKLGASLEDPQSIKAAFVNLLRQDMTEKLHADDPAAFKSNLRACVDVLAKRIKEISGSDYVKVITEMGDLVKAIEALKGAPNADLDVVKELIQNATAAVVLINVKTEIIHRYLQAVAVIENSTNDLNEVFFKEMTRLRDQVMNMGGKQ